MKIGEKHKGVITGIKPYGAFVHLDNGLVGLIHISEIKAGYIDDIHKLLKIGDDVLAQVIDYDEYNHKVSLSLRTLEEEKQAKKHRHRFSNSRIKIGFRSLEKELPHWINESLQFLRNK
ncbi:S1 RNA-binding domain-containing protein [Streptococcus sp. CSL10205-OR2]|uniref:S1 RNA-binding domain-containing protein n=1 Tax=Streptococcus sp. CSL10205-OR2 TaxID=2980558 RepID=UPI0021DB45AF|nr:S1 RNA-binding domain-containing protein [Streptococcus sp. CSL10205-OR2]MCU9533499.1 S1 RNA-binding domain-containing protein [Streptococcus sp. CSL10205-OR2]